VEAPLEVKMKHEPSSSKATLDRVPDTTGRDGAIDHAAKRDGLSAGEDPLASDGRFVHVLGLATVTLWGDLPQDIQEQVFERAVVLGHKSERDEMLREQLAKFLHDHHKRTTGHT
jgi:hypothetical protein